MKKLLLTTTMLVTIGACSTQSPAPVVGGLFGDNYRVVNEGNIQTAPIQNLSPIVQPNVEVSDVETESASNYRVATLQNIEPAAGPFGSVDTEAKPKDFGNYRMTHNRNYSSANQAVASAQAAVNNLQVAAATTSTSNDDIFSIQPAAGPSQSAKAGDVMESIPLTEEFTLYEVEKGDTLYSLAKDFDVSTARILGLNDFTSISSADVGKWINMPVKGSADTFVAPKIAATTQQVSDVFSIEPAAGPTTASTAAETYKVAKGDTLYSLSRKFGTSVGKIMATNNLTSPQQLTAGDVISMPSKTDITTLVAGSTPTTTVFSIEPAAGPTVTAPTAPAAPTVQAVVATSTATHKIQSGDTLYNLSKRYGTTVAALQSLNAGLNPTDISIGQSINVPSTTTAKSDKMSKLEPAAGTTSALQFAQKSFNSPDITLAAHKVQKGDNLYRIGLKYNVSVIDLMAANDFSKPQDLVAGSTIKLPLASGQTAVVQKSTQVNTAAARAKGMVWPAKGSLLSSFGQKGNGVTHTGVAIKLPENTPVMASEKGEVIYADSGLKSYGNLVLVRHTDGLVTAYAHNNSLKVSKGDTVKKGQTIALSGATGNVTTPQLHFEVRRNARAIDPTSVLPKI